MDIFSKNTKEALKKQIMSQRKLAQAMGVTPQTLNIWLTKKLPPMERFIQICGILKVSPNDLLGL